MKYQNNVTEKQELKKYNYMEIFNRIKITLVEKDKTGKLLAEQLGKSTCTVSKWCKNSIQPDIKTLNEIANLMDVDVKDLLVSNKETL